MCHIIMNKMDQWPAEWKREDKEKSWKELLGPRLNREWSYAKNEVVTRMRLTFLGKANVWFNVTCFSYSSCLLVSGEMNTDREITVENLESILNARPGILLSQFAPVLQKLAQFVCQYM
jgi:hypothetical protein